MFKKFILKKTTYLNGDVKYVVFKRTFLWYKYIYAFTNFSNAINYIDSNTILTELKLPV